MKNNVWEICLKKLIILPPHYYRYRHDRGREKKKNNLTFLLRQNIRDFMIKTNGDKKDLKELYEIASRQD